MEKNAQKNLTIALAEWSESMAELLQKALQHATPADLKRQIDSRAAKLFSVSDENGLIGAFVVRIDSTAQGEEGVIVAAAGDGGGINLLDTVLPAIEQRFIDVTGYRIHTARPGMCRQLVKNHGYEVGEIVLRKKAK